jgi:pSer/pThr/pTyr-binding forkhead associated (FHA) protein
VKHALVPYLVAVAEGTNISLDKPIMLIGRHQECDVQIPSKKISRRHCCLAQVNDHFVVRDLGSTNGIRINGVKVLEGDLQPEDELTIGNVKYQLKWGPEGEALSKPGKNGVKATHAARPLNDSLDVPIPVPEGILSIEAPTGAPKSMQIPDNVELVPLQTPTKSKA